MARRRSRYLLPLTLTLSVSVLSVPLAFAINAGSDVDRWPGWLDIVRRHPFWSASLMVGATLVFLGISVVRDASGPDAASTNDLLDTENRLHQRLDEVALVTTASDDRVKRLPPYPRALLLACGDDRPRIWQVVSSFVDDATDPRALAREWAASPPSALEDLPVVGRLAVAEILTAYGEAGAALEQLRAALRLGATPRAYWLVRAAQLTWTVEGDDSPQVIGLLTEAEGIDPDYPLLRALMLSHSGAWDRAENTLTGWTPATPRERDIALLVLSDALLQQQRLDDAITALEAGISETNNAGLLLQLAQLLRIRSVRGSGDSRWKDAFRAIELALLARNLRRSWRGDSAEAVAIAAEAAIVADDPQQVWSITRPSPDGSATASEAADIRVLPVAAMGAALTHRFTQARELAAHAPEGYVRYRIEAEIASAQPGDGAGKTAAAAWINVYRVSTTDEQKLHALRGLALEGATDRAALDDLRARHPEAVADIETAFEVSSITGPDADERLRELESRTPLASIRRANLLRLNDPQLAADILADATARWHDPRLLLMAVDCYVDAGEWAQADGLAQQALADGGMLWPGRATVLRRAVVIQSGLNNWPRVETACKALLEIDHNDDDARWQLAFAQFRSGEVREAWLTLNRASIGMEASTPHRALFLLELVHRCADSTRVAQTALAMLRAFPDDQDIHAAAIHAVTMRADRTELPDDIGREVTAAWSSFFERYPNSDKFIRYSISFDDENPLAEIEPQLREHAETYTEVLTLVREEIMPVGMLERVVSKPYSAIFPYRPLGYHRAASSNEHDIAVELEMARSAFTGACFVDASALYTLALIPEFAQTLISLIQRPTITDAALHDLIVADDLFSIPSSGTLAFDPQSGQIVLSDEPDVTQRQQGQIRTMLATARQFRRIMHPALAHLQSLDEQREPVWLLNLDAAKDSDSVIWADDLGLRRFAHSLGIKTFGTQSLLSLSHERRRLDESQLDLITRTLIREYVVDLPFDQGALLSVAAEQSWEPRSVATVLSRPASWSAVEPAFELFKTAFRKAADEMMVGWAHAALYGLNQASIPRYRHNNLVGLLAAVLCDDWVRPDHSRALIVALRKISPDEADGIIHATLDRVWKQMKKSYSTEVSVIVFLHIISRLDESNRQYAVRLILQDGSGTA